MIALNPINGSASEYAEAYDNFILKSTRESEYRASLAWRAEKSVGKKGNQCVQFVRSFLGASEISGMARNTKTNSQTPEIGSVIKTNESSKGHIGVVIKIEDKTLWIVESNVPLGSERIGIRKFKLDDPRILGYYVF